MTSYHGSWLNRIKQRLGAISWLRNKPWKLRLFPKQETNTCSAAREMYIVWLVGYESLKIPPWVPAHTLSEYDLLFIVLSHFSLLTGVMLDAGKTWATETWTENTAWGVKDTTSTGLVILNKKKKNLFFQIVKQQKWLQRLQKDKLIYQWSCSSNFHKKYKVPDTFVLLAGERVRACDVILRKHRRDLPSPVGRRQLSGAPGQVRSFKFSGSMDPNKRARKRNASKPKWLLLSCL